MNNFHLIYQIRFETKNHSKKERSTVFSVKIVHIYLYFVYSVTIMSFLLFLFV